MGTLPIKGSARRRDTSVTHYALAPPASCVVRVTRPSSSLYGECPLYISRGSAGPISVARPSSSRTRRSPPGKWTSTSPSPCVAAATATALEPDALVSPTCRLVAGAGHQPRARDPRAVAGHLCARAVRVDDHDLDLVGVDADDLDRAVVAGLEVVLAISDDVDVPVCVPARRCHRRSRPADDRRRP